MPPSAEQEARVKGALEKHGIVHRQSVFYIVQEWDGTVHDDLEDFLNLEM